MRSLFPRRASVLGALLLALSPLAAGQPGPGAKAKSAKAKSAMAKSAKATSAKPTGKAKQKAALRARSKARQRALEARRAMQAQRAPSAAKDTLAPIDGIPTLMTRWLGLQRTRSVQAFIDEQRLEEPDNRSLDALQGCVHAVSGRYVEALDWFERSEGSAYYEAVGIRFHAEALHAIGAVPEAVQLRKEFLLFAEASPANLANIQVVGTGDLIALGAYDEAAARADAIIASGTLWAAQGWADQLTLCALQGDLDCSLINLEMLRTDPRLRPNARLVVEFHHLVTIGALEEAAALRRQIGRRHGGRERFWLASMELDLRTDDPVAVLELLSRVRFQDQRSPSLRAYEAWARWAVGETDAGEAQILSYLADYPGNPDVRKAAVAMGLLDDATR